MRQWASSDTTLPRRAGSTTTVPTRTEDRPLTGGRELDLTLSGSRIQTQRMAVDNSKSNHTLTP